MRPPLPRLRGRPALVVAWLSSTFSLPFSVSRASSLLNARRPFSSSSTRPYPNASAAPALSADGLPPSPRSRPYISAASPHRRASEPTPQLPQPIVLPPPPPTFPPPSAADSRRNSHRQWTASIAERIRQYARQPQRGVTLQQLMAVTETPSPLSLLASAQFLHAELPIRLAKRVLELESLPYGLSLTSAVMRVADWYRESLQELLTMPSPPTAAEELSFTALLEKIYERHSHVVPMMAAGVLQMKQQRRTTGAAAAAGSSSSSDVVDQCPFLLDYLNRFFASRMGIRLLISQHVALHFPQPGYIGSIALHACPMRIIRQAVDDAEAVCRRELDWTPAVELSGDEQATFAFLPSHLHHIIFELCKNSMRAVVERHSSGPHTAAAPSPPISIVLSHDASDFAVRLSDQGGGIPRRDLHRIWSYLYTTKEEEGGDEARLEQLETGQLERMAGWGYGLPLSRLYARFFGGDLQVLSMPDYGTDCFLYLPKIGNEQLFLD